MNILPIPMLDGGHLLFILLEVVRGGKKMHQHIQEKLTQVCFIALLGFMAFILFNDVKTHLLGL
jgi:regulator of sigma E protease